jgi:hypothetical protein
VMTNLNHTDVLYENLCKTEQPGTRTLFHVSTAQMSVVYRLITSGSLDMPDDDLKVGEVDAFLSLGVPPLRQRIAETR